MQEADATYRAKIRGLEEKVNELKESIFRSKNQTHDANGAGDWRFKYESKLLLLKIKWGQDSHWCSAISFGTECLFIRMQMKLAKGLKMKAK